MKMPMTLIASLLLLTSVPSFANHAEAHAPKAVASEVKCPSQNFKKFIHAYAESEEVQKAFTKIPGVENDETTFPMIFDAERRKTESMNLKIEELKDKTAKVIIDKDETDYKVAFYFEKKKCWTLVKVDDLSG